MMLMWVPLDFFKFYELRMKENALPDKIEGRNKYLVSHERGCHESLRLYET